eukprot:2768324-Pleurochrysis_carterae.AAC.1
MSMGSSNKLQANAHIKSTFQQESMQGRFAHHGKFGCNAAQRVVVANAPGKEAASNNVANNNSCDFL